MRISQTPLLISGLLCVLLILTGCGDPSAASLDFLAVTATPATVAVGSPVVLHAVVHLGNGTTQDVTASTQWTLSNASLATLSNGVLTGMAPGSVTVQGADVYLPPPGQAAASTEAVSLSSSAQVTITGTTTTPGKTTPVVTWNTPSAIQYGTALSSVQLNATASVSGSFTYSPAVGTMLEAGTQKLTVIFTPSDTITYSTTTASVELMVTQVSPEITWAPLSPIQQGVALSTVQLDATANVPGTFTYTPAAGVVLAMGTQQLTVTFTPSNTTDYTPVTAHDSLTITAPPASTPIITWNTPAPIQYGTALSAAQLNAAANVPGQFAYKPAAGTVLGGGSEKLTAVFTPSDTTAYSAATSSVQLMVTQASPVITWAPLSAIQQGVALSTVQLDATANVPGTFTYTPAAGVVLAMGTQQLTVTFTPSNTTDYTPVTAHDSLTITAPPASTPIITWNTPTPIQYGTALSAAQLNAAANVPGRFAYTPAAGTVLGVGSQKLAAVFTPSDTTAYSAATSSVQLTVTQASPIITWAPLSAIQQGVALSTVQLDAVANIPGIFSYSPTAGTVLPSGIEQLTATFTPSNAADYSSATAYNSLTVSADNPAPVNGICGSANGTSVSVAPTTGLCSTGTASAVSGTGPWNWMCAGSNGGTSSKCMALAPVPEGVSAFTQSLGINTDLSYPDTPYYGQPQSVIEALQYLGINTIRDQPPGYTNDPTTTETDDAVAAAGVKFDVLILGNGPVDISGNLASIAAFEGAYPGVIAAIEAPNEINAWPITYDGLTNTYAAGVQVTQDLWTATQSSPSLEAIPVYALTLSNGMASVLAGEADLGNLAPYVTYGNAHVYACCSNNVWQDDMPYWLPIFEQATQGKPTVITETGYATIPSNVDEISAAKYNLNTLFENALNGIVRTYLYDLVDFNSSAADTNSDDHLGQYHDDWTPKAGATAIHNLTTILQSAGSGTASSTLNYSVAGLPTTGHSFLLGSSTAFDMAVWIDATIYDPTSDTDIAAPAYSVTVNLGATFGSVAVYDPMIGTTPIATYSNVSSLSISVTDHPLIVQVN
jgi:hypothetical protein